MPHPIINNLNDLESLLFAARAYDIWPIFDIHKKALENVEFIKQDPLCLFAIACACGLEDQASYVAKNAELLKVAKHPNPDGLEGLSVMDMVIFRTIFFELLVFFTFTLLNLHFAY